MSYRDWTPGDKVVCLDNAPPGNTEMRYPWTMLIVGATYTLDRIERRTVRSPLCPTDIFVDVTGIPSTNGEANFFATRFRKLNKPDEQKGNKEDFKLLLKQHAPKPLALPAPTKKEEKVK